MSTEKEQENEDLTLVHEDYIDEHQVDESELPQEIQDEITNLDAKVNEYNTLTDDADEAAQALEIEIEGMSRKIKVDIINFINSKPPVVAEVIEEKVEEVKVEETPIVDKKEEEKKEPEKPKRTSGNALVDAIFGI